MRSYLHVNRHVVEGRAGMGGLGRGGGAEDSSMIYFFMRVCSEDLGLDTVHKKDLVKGAPATFTA